MSSANPNDAMISNSGTSGWQNRGKRLILYVVVLLIVFLAGLVPMWLKSRTNASERDAAQASLQVSNLQNLLANAAIDARRADYEPARQAASDFFTKLQIELDRGNNSVFNEAQRNVLRGLFATRDEAITLLARSDPASADRLVDLYTKYRQATAGAPR